MVSFTAYQANIFNKKNRIPYTSNGWLKRQKKKPKLDVISSKHFLLPTVYVHQENLQGKQSKNTKLGYSQKLIILVWEEVEVKKKCYLRSSLKHLTTKTIFKKLSHTHNPSRQLYCLGQTLLGVGQTNTGSPEKLLLQVLCSTRVSS